MRLEIQAQLFKVCEQNMLIKKEGLSVEWVCVYGNTVKILLENNKY